MLNPVPQTEPISALQGQQDEALELYQLEVIQEARHAIALNDANQSWVSSAEMRAKMAELPVHAPNHL